MNRTFPALLLLTAAASLPAPAASPAPAVTHVDDSRRLYAGQSSDGSVVLGNGDPAPGMQPLKLDGPAVSGGSGLQAGNGEPITPELKAREEKLSLRVTQMFHRNHGSTH